MPQAPTLPTAIPALPAGIQSLPIEKWQNAHQNFVHQFQKNASFKLVLPDALVTNAEKYKATTKNFMWLIRYALDHNLHLRAMGNGWSFSEVAVCEGGVVDTKSLVLSFNLQNSFIAPQYLLGGKQAADLFFVQCGMSVLRVNEILETQLNPKRCLKASGASNGQSIAGCTATGTHGSAFNVGAVHDAIVGLHIVVGPQRHVWIEKKSNPVASPDFIEWLGAALVSDDDAFNAALVSFGSFGFIHGILLETAPIFLLEKHTSAKMPYNQAAVKAMSSLEFSAIAPVLPYPPAGPGKELYHFEIIINLNTLQKDDAAHGIYYRTMYKIPYPSNYKKIERSDKGFMYGDNTLGVIQTVIDNLGPTLSEKLVPVLVSKLFPLAFAASEESAGTIGEIFNNTRFRGQVGSTAIAVDCKDASRVMDEIVAVNLAKPFPGALAMRFVKGTKALLGFTRFEKTCVLELDGVDSAAARAFYEMIWQRLQDLSIPFTLHWGKMNYVLNKALVQKMYGEAAISRWKSCRNQLLDAPVRKVFTNKFMEQCGLDD